MRGTTSLEANSSCGNLKIEKSASIHPMHHSPPDVPSTLANNPPPSPPFPPYSKCVSCGEGPSSGYVCPPLLPELALPALYPPTWYCFSLYVRTHLVCVCEAEDTSFINLFITSHFCAYPSYRSSRAEGLTALQNIMLASGLKHAHSYLAVMAAPPTNARPLGVAVALAVDG